jgi:uncharacterized membrane protein YdfJ with MMPL/SSD domain
VDRPDEKEKPHAAQRWAGIVQKHPVLATVLSAAFILTLAAPALAMKLSFPDESAQARGTMGYASYATMAQGFGPGFDAPLIVAAKVPSSGSAALILFGLSMDYEVFLLSKIREEYDRLGDSRVAVGRGLAATARVISAAAAIMVVVFLSLDLIPDVSVKQIGLGLAAAVLIDATVVRLVLVPGVMELLGKANWWLPGWLDRLLPARRAEALSGDEPPAGTPMADPAAAR